MHKAILLQSILLVALLGAAFFHTYRKTNLTQQADIDYRYVVAFTKWTAAHKREYTTAAEKSFRLNVFQKNSLKIERFNAQATATWKMGLTQFADLTEEEFRAKLSFNAPKLTQEHVEYKPTESLQQQGNIDWRGYLQQQYISGSTTCNDNYAWVSAVTLNANYYIYLNAPIEYAFSPQVYIDCSGNFGNAGCGGGNAQNSFTYSKSYGVDSISDYPYYGYQRPCRAATSYFKNRDIQYITPGSNTILYNALSAKKVIASGIDIAGAQFYRYGVFQSPCSSTANQGVILVGAGYDFNQSANYWLLQNTWGPAWGENGFMRLIRYTSDGDQYTSCGLNRYALFPSF